MIKFIENANNTHNAMELCKYFSKKFFFMDFIYVCSSSNQLISGRIALDRAANSSRLRVSALLTGSIEADSRIDAISDLDSPRTPVSEFSSVFLRCPKPA
jgi:hypothetical protein